MTTLRTCRVCGRTKPLTKDNWHRAPRDSSGYNRTCKKCRQRDHQNKRKKEHEPTTGDDVEEWA